MENPGIFDLGSAQVSAAVSDVVITNGTTSAGVAQSLIDRLQGMMSVSLFAKFTYGSGGTSCTAVVQTSLNQGADWIDIARFDFATSNSQKSVNISAQAASAVAAVAALSSEGKLDGILGDRLRAKITTDGTYAGNTSLSIRACVR